MTHGSAKVSIRDMLLVPEGPPGAVWKSALAVALAAAGQDEPAGRDGPAEGLPEAEPETVADPDPQFPGADSAVDDYVGDDGNEEGGESDGYGC